MAANPEHEGHVPSVSEEEGVEELECPRCRQPVRPRRGRGIARCPTCGARLIVSARASEEQAWRHLYGRSAPGRPG